MTKVNIVLCFLIQEDINYQLHHHEKILRAEYMAMKVRYESQLERLQKEHIQVLQYNSVSIRCKV